MPFNVLLLPLLGGYLFLTHFNRTRFATKRYSGERLIFHSAIAGVALLCLLAEGDLNFDPESFNIVLPVGEINSANLFDPHAFEIFNTPEADSEHNPDDDHESAAEP